MGPKVLFHLLLAEESAITALMRAFNKHGIINIKIRDLIEDKWKNRPTSNNLFSQKFTHKKFFSNANLLKEFLLN